MKGLIVGRKNIAAYIGTSAKKIPLWAEKHELPAWKGPDGRWRATTERIDEWVDSHAVSDQYQKFQTGY